MGMHDFEVDLKALSTAAQKGAEVVQLKKDKDVEDYVPSESDISNTILWDAMREFRDRWERGTNDMTEDLEEVAGRLGKVVMNYLEYMEQSQAKMETLRNSLPELFGEGE